MSKSKVSKAPSRTPEPIPFNIAANDYYSRITVANQSNLNELRVHGVVKPMVIEMLLAIINDLSDTKSQLTKDTDLTTRVLDVLVRHRKL